MGGTHGIVQPWLLNMTTPSRPQVKTKKRKKKKKNMKRRLLRSAPFHNNLCFLVLAKEKHCLCTYDCIPHDSVKHLAFGFFQATCTNMAAERIQLLLYLQFPSTTHFLIHFKMSISQYVILLHSPCNSP